MPLHRLMDWSPFRLDALGLVTLIGADEVNQAVGRLVYSRYTAFLPLLGQYFIAGNQFTSPLPGFTLYNLTDGIMTTSVAGWFSRWLRSQKLRTSTTVFEWTVLPENQKRQKKETLPLLIGSFILCAMFVLTILMGDWWGLGNSVALAVSVFVRWYMVRENNIGMDECCEKTCRPHKGSQASTRVKILVTLDNGKMVTIYAPRGLVMAGFLKKPSPVHQSFYVWTRRIGWLFFGVHVIALGQCNLVTQILTVFVLVCSTWLVVRGFGCDEHEIGNSISVHEVQSNTQEPDRRMWAYSRLNPTVEEEDSLIGWNLLPRKTNRDWWKDYSIAKQTLNAVHEKPSDFCSVLEVRSDSDLSTLSPGYSESQMPIEA